MYSAIQQQQMLAAAHGSIHHGLTMGTRLEVNLQQYDTVLHQPCATFVTLKIDSLLKGCIGSIQTEQSLIENLSENAYCAAFEDNRFPALTHDELSLLEIEIALLGDLEQLPCATAAELVAQLRPGADGLVLTDGDLSATFLPSIWQQVNHPEHFVRELSLKAGIDYHHWNPDIMAERYSVVTIQNKSKPLSMIKF
ncbi:AmmeMemoRadiSam system protein A [Oceanicoccus sp. KOV_DT_Chl]|uniref:AmmeMemoRadiSam system protein A n=1 Tax=Oceanicoccus sp. KOV_DT_Chl TaxID=1904639 RepID=UPI000C7C79AF|nr:AmmeMemoRadiSam system protein A [Oceanicoccus sp. KOV_DT_Chl]